MEFKYKKTVSLKNFEKELDFLINSIRELKLPTGFSNFIPYVISELFINIKEHAQVNKGLILLEIKNKKCLIEVRDKGIGLRGSYLKKGFFPKDDISAIEFALSGLSTKTSKERGFGLYSIRKLVEALKGELSIISGFGKVLIRNNKITYQNLSKKFSGTIVKIETPIKKIDFYKIII